MLALATRLELRPISCKSLPRLVRQDGVLIKHFTKIIPKMQLIGPRFTEMGPSVFRRGRPNPMALVAVSYGR